MKITYILIRIKKLLPQIEEPVCPLGVERMIEESNFYLWKSLIPGNCLNNHCCQ